MQEPTFAAFIGLDWADKKHDVCLQAAGASASQSSVIEHRPAAIAAWADGLRERFGGAPVAVCVELSEGPIVSALLEHEFLVLYPVNPSTLAKYRRAFAPSGAKDDPTDAQVALELLVRHRDKLKPLRRDSGEMRALRRLVEVRRDLVQDRVRVTNRLTYALKAYYPQVLQWVTDRDTTVFIDFLERWPSLPAVQRARRDTLVAFFRQHHVRHASVIEGRIESIKTERPLTSDPGVIEPAQLVVEALLPQLRALNTAIDRFEERIAAKCSVLPDYAIFAPLPGAGPALAPRLLTAFGENRDRFESAAAVQKYSGVAPVTERSGNKQWVHWRWSSPTFVRQTFVEWAAGTIPQSFWAGAYYHQQRAKGASHNAAVRALAFKWIRILYRCWVDRTPYDESKYLLALQRRSAPLLKFAAENPS